MEKKETFLQGPPYILDRYEMGSNKTVAFILVCWLSGVITAVYLEKVNRKSLEKNKNLCRGVQGPPYILAR